jgi:hypothetical protein
MVSDTSLYPNFWGLGMDNEIYRHQKPQDKLEELRE